MAAPKAKKPAREGARRRGGDALEDVSRRTGRRITRPRVEPPRIRKTGKIRRRIEPPLSPAVRRERAARTKQVLKTVEELLPEIPRDELGGATPKQFLARLESLLERIEIEKYATTRLLRSKGLKWSWFGEVWEEVIAANQKLWNELGGYAGVELKDLNDIIKNKAAAGLLNGRGEPAADMKTPPPGPFRAKVEVATDVRLSPRAGRRRTAAGNTPTACWAASKAAPTTAGWRSR